MDITAILVFFCLASAVITYSLGLCVFAKNPGSLLHRLFLLAMLAASWWAAGEFMIWQSAGYEAVRFWLKASAIWPLAIVLMAHFILAFTAHPLAKRHNLKYLLPLLYGPAVIVALTGIFTDLLYTVVPSAGGGFIYVPVTGSPAYLTESFLFVILIVFSLSICISAWLKQPPGRVRQQNFLLSIGTVIVIISGTISAFFLPLAGIHIPNTVFCGIVCFSIIIAYAIIRQGLFTLTPESAAANILRIMPDGLLIADRDGRIVTANASAEALFRRENSDLTGQPVESVLPRECTDAIQQAFRESGTFSDLEAILAVPGYRVVSIAGARITDPGGEPAGTVLIIHDITSRKKSERALRLAKDKVSLLSQLTRHDITNLVTALNGYILLLSEKITDPVPSKYIAASSEILEKIDQHLQFSREYEKIGQHEPVWQSLEETVVRAKADLPVSLAAFEISLPPIEIYADPLTVKVVYNLLENALRHGGPDLTRVRVTTVEGDGGELVILFEDNGTGIPADEKELIFTHGFGKNTGLGLTLSREILAVTDIRLIETGIPGKGARFEMHVPRQSWKRG
ncbi:MULTISPECIES: histidine kinase N-terminal 7TM domain-containing protein [unclassified Methanoregula]|uniref:histidine kinase N-terminal 7TM domain-containing protein n=1 Tax=unclassified Methanoregula TaxID=2649730 RepID=UPI0009D42273|nr:MULTISPECIES: histidine kinase N-terminal 7TM domain-containing protein [unclassified Methanoregula]OPX64226.1 MAG: sensory histidine kinase AtoS [Methanoregula sp. PtaB.Bin085]OPY33650.1 MAG: sensory histidine kinase AtoS [Methanoregula sp. PtaU1.Bin006]